MQVLIPPHTLLRAEERGTSEHEIHDVLESGEPLPAQRNRFRKMKTYTFAQLRLGKFYEQKRVEVIYTVEKANMVAVTVYVFYGKWEENL